MKYENIRATFHILCLSAPFHFWPMTSRKEAAGVQPTGLHRQHSLLTVRRRPASAPTHWTTPGRPSENQGRSGRDTGFPSSAAPRAVRSGQGRDAQRNRRWAHSGLLQEKMHCIAASFSVQRSKNACSRRCAVRIQAS